MSDWLKRQWRDIRGNFKWFVVTAMGGLCVSVMSELTRAELPWRRFAITGMFAVFVIWAVVATRRVRRPPSLPAAAGPAPVVSGSSDIVLLNIPLGAYRKVTVGKSLHETTLRIELIEITEKRKPSSPEDSPPSRCIRLGIDGEFLYTAGDAWEQQPTRAKGFEIVLFEFGYIPAIPSLGFSFHPKEDGFSFLAIVVEHIDAEAKTVELRVYQADIWRSGRGLLVSSTD